MHDAVKLLDVTLRDGGYKTNFHFSATFIQNVLPLLDQSGIPYIEVGYRNGPFKLFPNIGQTGICSGKYLTFCKKLIKYAKLTVIFHPKNIHLDDLKEMKDCGVDAIRICLPKNPILGLKSLEMAKKFGFETFVNIVRVSNFNKENLRNWIINIENLDPSGIYLADSNGSLTPNEIESLFSYLYKNVKSPLGFHAHDNLFLAQTNAITAIKNGVQFIDSSLLGFGKGSGNLRTEGIVSFLYAQGNKNYNLCKLIEAAQYVSKKNNKQNLLSAQNIILGMFNLSQDDAESLGSFINITDYYTRASSYIRN